MRIGHGYDVHRFGSDKKLILGGVEIPFGVGLIAHSDGDVVLHALCDALLGAASLRDIGFHFPDNSNEFKDISSIILLKRVYEMITNKGYALSNCDITVIAEKPKLSPFIPEMVKTITEALDIDKDRINIKATTEEGLGLAGNGIGCHAVCLIDKE
ncbi:MAG: 2-C-methyl-D-erythritol 2,4-cyclodiphosphate synthase [Clostridiales bacterium]|jgi:2-C-methyl-D-erythritol 2,4-cyclodiphosphate synthase|nr:2-C-methyl-D-erythritol 2,4-cyclodiphosphate synthase [Clostridiales bacterium]